MDDDASSDMQVSRCKRLSVIIIYYVNKGTHIRKCLKFQKCFSDEPLDNDEGPLINENSNGLSHLLTEGEFNSVDAAVDESSASNPGFLNAVELSAGSVGDYLENNANFEGGSFDVGDNAVTFPSESLNNVLADGDSMLSDAAFKASDTEGDITDKNNMENDFDVSESDASCPMPAEDSRAKTETEDENTNDLTNDTAAKPEHVNAVTLNSSDVEMVSTMA